MDILYLDDSICAVDGEGLVITLAKAGCVAYEVNCPTQKLQRYSVLMLILSRVI